jgi:hypothetical protein
VSRLLVIPVLAIALAGCGSDAKYSTDEVVDAFEQNGFTLGPLDLPGDRIAGLPEGELLVPRSGAPFVVVVGLPEGGDKAWEDYKAQQDQDGDSFVVRRGNVIAISDGGLSRFDRGRVVSAMSALPDRGADVDIAGQV